MTIPPVGTSAAVTERSLQRLEQALGQNKKYVFAKNKEGTVEIVLKKVGFFATIKNWFTHSQRKLANSFLDQTLNVVDNEDVDKNLRKKILSKVTTDDKTTTALFDRVIKKAHAKKKTGEIHAKFSSALDHIQAPSIPSVVPSVISSVPSTPSLPLAPSRKKEAEAFKSKFEQGHPVTLFDARPYVEYDWEQRMTGHSDAGFYKKLKAYYADSHQASGFEEIEVAARISVFANTKTQLSKNTKELCQWIVNDIKDKAKQHPSVHGHPRDLYTKEDLANLQAIVKSFPPANPVHQQASAQLNKIQESVGKSNLTLRKYSSLFQRLEATQTPSISLILEAKNAWMEIELLSGRYLELDLLKEHPTIPEITRKGLERLSTLDQTRSKEIDQAMLQSFIEEHGKALRHPRVAIEGAGPTGLLLAITQFRAGAEVSIFEKRSTIFDRTQIVRLDPKWMTMLKFYLGEDYYKLFIDEGKKGIIRSDGFGEISTKELEDVLHNRLTELISLIPPVKRKIPPLERFAAHEITRVYPPAVGKKFVITAYYSERFDVADAPQEVSRDQQSRDIDMMICAGGKSSLMKDTFLPSSTPVSQKENYGVCSWVSRRIPGQDRDKMDLFQDFRNMIKVDEGFRNRFKAQLNDTFSPDGIVASSVNEKLLKEFSDQMNSLEFNQFIKNGPLQPFIQTRTFENLGLIYIGMEIPVEVNALFKNFEASLDNLIVKGKTNEIIELEKKIQDTLQHIDVVDYFLKKNPTLERQNRKNSLESELPTLRAELEAKSPGHAEMARHKQFMMETLRKIWFQNVMDTYGLSQKHGLTIDTIDPKFAAMFPVDQNRMHQAHSFSTIKSHSSESELLILAAGDAFASPHFMRYSGLTGARENILDYQDYTRHVSRDQNPDQKGLLSKLRHKGERTASFVIERGKAFLTPKTQQEIDKTRRDRMIALLDKEVVSRNGYNYTVKKVGEGRYEAHKGLQKIVILPQAGFFRVEGSEILYDSFEQIKYNLQLAVSPV